jgi:hypothetical protein
MPHSNLSSTGLSEASRHSSIFRFGKSIAASFNPSNWKLFNKHDRVAAEMENEDPQQKVLRERQAKAEKIYAELKQTGHFPNLKAQSVEAFVATTVHNKHDSAIVLPDAAHKARGSMESARSMSREDKRMGRIFLEPPSSVLNQRGASPAISNISTPSRNSLQQLKKASLSNIKKKFSIDRLNDSNIELPGTEHSARRLPARKELEKQQRLVKRVSDLEGKLEAARRQLNAALAEPLPSKERSHRSGRKQFVPGAMPTLPSERLLSAYVQQDEDDRIAEIGNAVLYDPSLDKVTREEDRGRSRQVREPEMSPSHFYPTNSYFGGDVVDQDHPLTSIEDDGEFVKREKDTTRPLKQSKSTNSSTSDDSNFRAVVASEKTTLGNTSSLEQPAADLTSEIEGHSARNNSEHSLAPRRKVRTPPKRKPVSGTTVLTRKRKSIVDGIGAHKASAVSALEDGSDLIPVKKQTLKRKSVGIQARKIQKSKSIGSPPSRLPPPPPKSGGLNDSVEIETKDLAGNETVISTSSSSEVPPPVPTRAISRKAVAESAPSSSSRTTKPSSVKSHPRARQSVTPPPSITTFEPALEYVRPSRKAAGLKQDDHVGVQNDQVIIQPIAPTKRASLDNSIPPMPKLPKTNGEVVDVKVNAPLAVPRTSTSRTRSRTRDGSSVSTSRVPNLDSEERVPKLSNIPNLSAKGQSEIDVAKSKSGVSRSDTKSSFEWPADCF